MMQISRLHWKGQTATLATMTSAGLLKKNGGSGSDRCHFAAWSA